jgi:hypothetical protein
MFLTRRCSNLDLVPQPNRQVKAVVHNSGVSLKSGGLIPALQMANENLK